MLPTLSLDLIVKLLVYVVGPLLGVGFVYYKGYSSGKANEQDKHDKAVRKAIDEARTAEAENQTLDYERDRQIDSISDIKSDDLLRLFNEKLWGKNPDKPAE